MEPLGSILFCVLTQKTLFISHRNHRNHRKYRKADAVCDRNEHESLESNESLVRRTIYYSC